LKLTNRSTEKDTNKANFLYHVMDKDLSSVQNTLQNHNQKQQSKGQCIILQTRKDTTHSHIISKIRCDVNAVYQNLLTLGTFSVVSN